MTQAQKLEALIRKAIEGGWDTFGTESQQIDVEVVKLRDGELQPDIGVDKPGIYVCVHRHHGTYSMNDIIFNRDFTKALFGEEEAGIEDFYSPKHNELSGSYWPKMWEYHLQQMVIADDTIDYAYKAVFGEA